MIHRKNLMPVARNNGTLVVATGAIDSGRAAETLDRFVAVSQQAAEEFGH